MAESLYVAAASSLLHTFLKNLIRILQLNYPLVRKDERTDTGSLKIHRMLKKSQNLKVLQTFLKKVILIAFSWFVGVIASHLPVLH